MRGSSGMPQAHSMSAGGPSCIDLCVLVVLVGVSAFEVDVNRLASCAFVDWFNKSIMCLFLLSRR